jgi:hypothetical protein
MPALKPIPHFKNEDEERELWATHDSTDYVDWSKGAIIGAARNFTVEEIGRAFDRAYRNGTLYAEHRGSDGEKSP